MRTVVTGSASIDIGIECPGKRGLRFDRAGRVPRVLVNHGIPPESAVLPGHALTAVPGARS